VIVENFKLIKPALTLSSFLKLSNKLGCRMKNRFPPTRKNLMQKIENYVLLLVLVVNEFDIRNFINVILLSNQVCNIS